MLKLFFSYIKYFFQKPECDHPNICSTDNLSYCPDCGALIEINWYLLRCNCCGKKRTGFMKNGEIIPLTNFCSNCGMQGYVVEKIKNINYFDMNFAVVKKETVNEEKLKEYTQVWVEDETKDKSTELLPLLLS